MISISTALKIIRRETIQSGPEAVALDSAVGRVLAEPIFADADLPPFDRSQMDGFAVNSADTADAPVNLKVVGESAAGRGWHREVRRGEAVRIMTGAPVPKGADAVKKIEQTREKGPDVIQILKSADKGEAVVFKGAEIRKGTKVLSVGEIVTANNISVAAAFGYHKINVARQPRIGILSTGSEIVDIEKSPGRDQIRNSNSAMLRALAESCGAVATCFPIAEDNLKSLKTAILSASKGKEILIISGGVSVGKYDLTKTAIKDLGSEIFIENLRLKPGKPAVFARLGPTLVFGLPGNPVSSAVTFYLLVRTTIRRMQGLKQIDLVKGVATLTADCKAAKDRDTFLPSRTEIDNAGRAIVQPLKWQGSSDFVGFARANSLIYVPAGKRYKTGDTVEIRYL